MSRQARAEAWRLETVRRRWRDGDTGLRGSEADDGVAEGAGRAAVGSTEKADGGVSAAAPSPQSVDAGVVSGGTASHSGDPKVSVTSHSECSSEKRGEKQAPGGKWRQSPS